MPDGAAYHSAVKHVSRLQDSPPVTRATVGGSVALVSNLLDGLAPEFLTCDLLYLEPPWPAGFREFNRRAGITDEARSHGALVSLIGSLASTLPFPVVVSEMGIPSRRRLESFSPDSMIESSLPPHSMRPIRFYGWRIELPQAVDSRDLVRSFAGTYHRIGDPCCGYGRTALDFLGAGGGEVVMSDINADCIGYIAQNLEGWRQHG